MCFSLLKYWWRKDAGKAEILEREERIQSITQVDNLGKKCLCFYNASNTKIFFKEEEEKKKVKN